jgi:hypothetical protein
LLSRVSALEHNLDDVTGSIGPGSGAPPRPSSAQALPQIPATPQAAASPAPTAPAASSTPPAGAPGTAAPNRVASGHLATGNPAAAESVATKTEFGIDIGGNPTVEGVRALWATLKSHQPALLEGLRPVVAVRDGQKPGTIELRLVAGPVANAATAARLCAAFAAASQPCQPTVFDGQRLALQ